MTAIATGRAVLDRARDAEVTFLGAAIAYYALVSVVPALLLGVVLATALGGGALAERVLAAAGGLLTPAGEAAVGDALDGTAGRAGASIVGVVVLLWSTLKVFRGLDIAFSRVYGTARRPGLLEGVRDAAVGLLSVGIGIGAMLLLGGALVAAALPVAGWLLGLAALLVGLFVAFWPLYYVFPDAPVTAAEAVPGAALAAVGWVGLQAGFQAYAAVAASYELYGVLGGVLLLVTWFYVASSLLLLGAVLNVVLADRQAEKAAGRGD